MPTLTDWKHLWEFLLILLGIPLVSLLAWVLMNWDRVTRGRRNRPFPEEERDGIAD